MTKVREKLEELYKECEELSKQAGWVGPKTGQPNLRLIYTSVESFEHGNKFAIVGLNPGGGKSGADTDDPYIPFQAERYSAYLDDNWENQGTGRSRFQRAVQGVAMILRGTDYSEAIEAIYEKGIEPEKRIGNEGVDFLRQTPSLNIIPFRSHTLADLQKNLPSALQQRGEEIGWELICLMRPKPLYIVTLSNGSLSPWSTILKNSHQSPDETDYERLIRPRRGQRGSRTYREVKLIKGPLKGALVFGLPAVVSDDIDDDKIREEVTRPLFEVLQERLRYHKVSL